MIIDAVFSSGLPKNSIKLIIKGLFFEIKNGSETVCLSSLM
jgi:hypothetical protein